MKVETPASNPHDAKRPASSFILHPSSLAVFTVIARILVGGTFVLAATLKLIAPVENMEAAVRGFQLVPGVLERPIALVLPWIELFAGTFCLLGLFTRFAAWVLAILLAVFIGALAWAKFKGLDLQNCGCFARWDFIQSPNLLLLRDVVLLLLALPLLRKQRYRLSLEEYAQSKA
ncbi:MAG: DoxX family membrane protein [Verrucomicrobiae bacterium]|nr:DoxX family membrane protein [Verrucomicrobiae bacterium]